MNNGEMHMTDMHRMRSTRCCVTMQVNVPREITGSDWFNATRRVCQLSTCCLSLIFPFLSLLLTRLSFLMRFGKHCRELSGNAYVLSMTNNATLAMARS